jgi:single-stranded-DNA-specific exonuclease
VERVHRPTVLIAVGDREGKGSARSIPGFHLFEAFDACRAHLLRFGGHRAAAGCSILPDRIDGFREAFDLHARSALSPDLLTPELRIDVELKLSEAGGDLHRLLRHAAPFGMGNPTPTLAARGVGLEGGVRVVGAGGHLKMTFTSGDGLLDAIGFGMGDRAAELQALQGRFDIAFRLEENTWNGRSSMQARLLDIRAAE